MSVALVTGSGGLVGSETVRLLARKGLDVVGVDNDTRSRLFGAGASTRGGWQALEREIPGYVHIEADIRDPGLEALVFERYGRDIALVVHAAAQPSHDWAARDPAEDFSINATATLGLLEWTRRHCPDAVFVFCSTNKVYGDTPNRLGFIEQATRWELPTDHPFHGGIDESMSVDATMHSLFGVSKVSADLLVQEYGRYFGLRSACFRGGCITGPAHAGAKLHGFLSYLVQCGVTGRPYSVIGYGGKQVRDNIDARDLAAAFWSFFQRPRAAAVYNIGGGRRSNCSVLEAIAIVERLTGRPMSWTQEQDARAGDHQWWISDTSRFETEHPDWMPTRGIEAMIAEIAETAVRR
jgi:CDP-paratose 2-epimerase